MPERFEAAGVLSMASKAETMAKKQLLEDIKTNPANFYRTPSDVARDRRFSDAEKLEILEAWERDARALSVADDEGMTGRRTKPAEDGGRSAPGDRESGAGRDQISRIQQIRRWLRSVGLDEARTGRHQGGMGLPESRPNGGFAGSRRRTTAFGRHPDVQRTRQHRRTGQASRHRACGHPLGSHLRRRQFAGRHLRTSERTRAGRCDAYAACAGSDAAALPAPASKACCLRAPPWWR